jgi:DNA primase
VILQSKLLALVNEVLSQTSKLRKGGSQATYFCPFCNHWKRKLEVNLDFGQWHCWVCHARGSYLGSLLSRVNAPQRYRDRLFEITKDNRIYRKSHTKEKDEELVLPEEFLSLAKPPLLDARYPDKIMTYRNALGYLKKRGIEMDDICRYNIGYCEAGEYKDCVVIPSYDPEGKLNFFSSRYIYPHKWLKYKNAPFSKNIIGFGLFINFDEPVTLVEGAFDAIATRINAVPLFGTLIPAKLKEALVIHKTPRVNLALDADAMKEATNAVQELWRWGISVHLVKLTKKDPSELGFGPVHDLIENSRQFEFEDLIRNRLME